MKHIDGTEKREILWEFIDKIARKIYSFLFLLKQLAPPGHVLCATALGHNFIFAFQYFKNFCLLAIFFIVWYLRAKLISFFIIVIYTFLSEPRGVLTSCYSTVLLHISYECLTMIFPFSSLPLKL